MFGLGIVEIIIVALVVLLAVKPEDLPKFFKKIGKSYSELKNTVSEVKKMKDEFVDMANSDIDINSAATTTKENANEAVNSDS